MKKPITRITATAATLAGEIMHSLGMYLRAGEQVGMFLGEGYPAPCCRRGRLTEKVLHEAHVFITPGFIFGSNGKRYIRISLCCKDENWTEALETHQGNDMNRSENFKQRS